MGSVCPATPAAFVAGGLMVLLTLPGALSAAPPQNDPVVARVNGVELHRSDLEAERHELPPQAQKVPLAKIYPGLLKALVDGELVVQAGHRDHLEKAPEVQVELKRTEDRLIQRAYLSAAIKKATTDAALKARYQKVLKEHPPMREIHARQILVKTEAEAKSIIAQLDKGADFIALAKKYSTDPSGKSGGDLGYFTRAQMIPAISSAAFALPVGAYTKTPIKTEFGWHIIKVDAERRLKPPSIETVRPQLEKLIARDVIKKTVEELRSSAKIETFGLDGKPLPIKK